MHDSSRDLVAPPAAATAVAAPAAASTPAWVMQGTGTGGGRPVRAILMLGVLLLAALAGAGIWYSMQQEQAAVGLDSRYDDEAYSFYHDRYFDAGSYRAQFDTDRMIDRADRWQYDGPYEYGSYGSKGMAQRRKGKGRAVATDPLASGPEELPDVFELYGNSDPTGGRPVGDAWAAWTDPTYNPYAGYSNPYANRIRMAWGPGYGRAAWQER